MKKRAAVRSPQDIEGDVENCNRHGVLFASGLIVGESLMGVIMAAIIVISVTSGGDESPLRMVDASFWWYS